MTTASITLDQPTEHEGHVPAGWWLVPSVLAGTGLWIAGLMALVF
jgi:hypothetical protein